MRLASRTIDDMPTAAARYDVIYNDGSGLAVSDNGRNRALVDMHEERLPDDWGDPGRLIAARLLRYRARYARSMEYAPMRGRMALWVDGSPRRVRAERLFLRWAVPDADPAPHDDPDWVIPP